MKKVISLLLCLCVLLTAALAQAEFVLPEGCKEFMAGSTVEPIPEGLAPMYALMSLESYSSRDSVEVIRMKNGRVLVSFALDIASKEYTPEELQSYAGAIAQRIAGETAWADGAAAEAEISTLFQTPCLSMTTNLAAAGETDQLLITAKGWLIPVDSLLLEVWMVSPAQPVYVYDEQAAKELEEDLSDAENLLANMTLADFGIVPESEAENSISSQDIITMTPSTADLTVELPETVTYTDPNGIFTMDLPVGSIVLDSSSTPEDFTAARAAYVAAHPAGGDTVFTNISVDVEEGEGVLILTPDYQASLEVYLVNWDVSWADLDTAYLAYLTNPTILSRMGEAYGFAEQIISLEEETVNGKGFSRNVFRGKAEDYTLLLTTLAYVNQGSPLVIEELDFTAPEGSASGDVLYRLAVETFRTLQ